MINCEIIWIYIDVDLVATFNAAEAGLWTLFAVLVANLGRRVRGLGPRLRVFLALAFLAFGVSDLIEMSTGAWWRPPGLLAYKGACLLGIIIGGLLLWQNRRVHGRV
jgi:hypothetical protein